MRGGFRTVTGRLIVLLDGPYARPIEGRAPDRPCDRPPQRRRLWRRWVSNGLHENAAGVGEGGGRQGVRELDKGPLW